MSWQQVIAASPYLAFFAFCALVSSLSHCVVQCWCRFLRSVNIRKHGWPPVHCDADGDFAPKKKEPEDA